MNNLESATDAFIKVLLDSEVYLSYRTALEKVRREPGLKERIDEFRRRNFELQMSTNIDFQKLDSFEKEYADFLDHPLTAAFLEAELALCRTMQGVNMRVTEALDFD